MSVFFMEIGAEEIPSRFLRDAERNLASACAEALKENNLNFADIRAYSTPRRLAITVRGLPETQPETEEIVVGPALKIAYNEDGTPGRALQGFLKGQGASLANVFTTKTEKGEYVAVKNNKGGRATRDILTELAPKLITSLTFPKSMRWGEHGLVFARPVRWIVALYDDEVLDFSLEKIRAGRVSRGLRQGTAAAVEISSATAYPEIMEKAGVVVDPEKRRECIRQRGDVLAKEVGGEIVWKETLLDEVTGLVERPEPILGEFDPAFLEVPEEVLLTSMESHQKSFGVRGKDGLLPYFLATLNIVSPKPDLVRAGWERVLRARLEDARFFWRTDLNDSLENWSQKLESVTFIGPLGTMADKCRRLEKLCGWLAREWTPPANEKEAELAGKLAKVDLVSGMVGEFDNLQGIMGGIYARKAGVAPAVADAIKEQYLPAGPDSPTPKTALGSILSVADKADSLAGCFGLGIIPTGAADSYGLRRHALGIIRIFLASDITLPLDILMERALAEYGDRKWKFPRDEIIAKLLEFFRGRLKNYFQNLGYDTTLVDAVLAAGFNNVPDCAKRLGALAAFRKESDFEPLAWILKRVANITAKEANVAGDWSEDLLPEDAERKLSAALRDILPAVEKDLNARRYGDALAKLRDLRAPVDNFFDNVMALCEDEKLRRNRLRMLAAIREKYSRVAAFALLQV